MNAYLHHLSYDFRTGLRDKSLMLMNYLFPLAFYAMMGLLMTGINPEFKKTLVPAMIVNAMMTSGLMSLPNPFVDARSNGIFRSFRINGVPAINLVSIPLVSVMLHNLIIAGIVLATAAPLFDGLMPERLLVFIPLVMLGTFAMAGLGTLIGVVAPGARASLLLGIALYVPSMMLSGMMVPTSMLPPALFKVAFLLPATHAMNAFNALSMGQPAAINPAASALILLAGGLISFGLAVYLFEWDAKLSDKRRPRLLALLALAPYMAGVLLAMSV